MERVPEQATADRPPSDAEDPLWAQVRELPEKQRAAVFLRSVGDLSYADVASRAGVLAGRRPAQRARGAQAAAPGGALVRELNLKVAERAEREGLLDVAYATVDSPVRPADGGGHRARPGAAGLPRAATATTCWRGWPASCRRGCSRRRRAWTRVRRELDEYFDGRRRAFETPVDFSLSRGFYRKVLEATAKIGYGQTSTYAGVAAGAGSPKAVRAAGSGLGSNPIPVVVPCHRVLRTGGALGGYTGGLERKEFLLSLERR